MLNKTLKSSILLIALSTLTIGQIALGADSKTCIANPINSIPQINKSGFPPICGMCLYAPNRDTCLQLCPPECCMQK